MQIFMTSQRFQISFDINWRSTRSREGLKINKNKIREEANAIDSHVDATGGSVRDCPVEKGISSSLSRDVLISGKS